MTTKSEPNPLEEAVRLRENWDERAGALTMGERHALAAIRVLMEGHKWDGCVCGGECAPSPGHWALGCSCGLGWPCPILTEAAKALRGEKE